MSYSDTVRVRPSVRYLQEQYDRDNKRPLEDLVRAWKGIVDLPPEDPNSFFQLGGYHGEPFIYRPAVDSLMLTDTYLYWGGYCNHGNVLFPTWHRIYLYTLEKALQSIVPGVMMPYWDETSEASLAHGAPDILTRETFTFSNVKWNGELAGKTIDNPLQSFVLPMTLSDDMNFPSAGDSDHMYGKPQGYHTVRYPLSGLVGTAAAREVTRKHNAKYEDKNVVDLFNQNIRQWLHGVPPETPSPTKPKDKFSIYQRFKDCLEAPNYTVFSNTTSAAAWNRGSREADVVIALEDPHNDIHLAIGGFDVTNEGEEEEFGILAEANGDMGENNTAAMDPIFFFHHCNIDRMFWLWQKRNDCTDEFDIMNGYPGTSSTDSQGPTPGFPPNATLDLDTSLHPFRKKDENGLLVPYTSRDCFNIETQLNYTYSQGSFEGEMEEVVEADNGQFSDKTLVVTGIDRALFQGSFILKAYATVGDERYYLGHYSVLSRRNVVKCANCLTHLEVQAFFPLTNVPAEAVEEDLVEYDFKIHHRGPDLHPDLAFEYEIRD